jgi:flagellar M-ring protein FliF
MVEELDPRTDGPDVQSILNFLGQMGRGRLLLMGAVAALLLAVLGTVAFRGSSPEMGFLYTGLEPEAASKIADQLKSQNVPYQVTADGTSLMVPRDRMAELRMSLASQQLGAKIGYDVLDAEQPFGVSASRAKMNETRAIEGELAKSIATLDSVTGARVQIVMPERELFASEPRKSTASVTLKTLGRLKPEQINSIRYLVSSAVPELLPENISIVDQTGALLARAGELGTDGGGDLEQQQTAAAARLRSQIEALLEPIYGAGKVRAEVSVQLERSQTREESEVYDPENQVIQRQVSVESSDQNTEGQNAQPTATTVSNQLPENAAGGGAGNNRATQSNQTSEDTTYQNSITRKVLVNAPGSVKRLTVAVTIDGGKAGVPKPQIQQVTRLVENSVGAVTERGDSVIVESMAFAKAADVAEVSTGLPLGITMDQIMSVLKLLIIAGAGIVVLRILRSRGGVGGGGAEGQFQLAASGAPAASPSLDAVFADAQNALSDNARADALRMAEETAANKKNEVINQLGNRVATDPTAAANVFRQWLNG